MVCCLQAGEPDVCLILSLKVSEAGSDSTSTISGQEEVRGPAPTLKQKKGRCLSQCSIAGKRHHDPRHSYKESI